MVLRERCASENHRKEDAKPCRDDLKERLLEPRDFRSKMSNNKQQTTVRNGGLASNCKQKRFSIDDAFEEETDEAIRVYGTVGTPTSNGPSGDCVGTKIENGRAFKFSNDARDSDSLIQDCYDGSSQDFAGRSCFAHPKVRENWRMVLAATLLLLIGGGLIVIGAFALADKNAGLQGAVFLLTGFICFLPGAYHVVYIYLAAKGKRGYHFHNLPLFS